MNKQVDTLVHWALRWRLPFRLTHVNDLCAVCGKMLTWAQMEKGTKECGCKIRRLKELVEP